LIDRKGGPIDPSDHNFIHSIKPMIDLVHPSCARREGSVRERGRGTGQGRPHLQGRSCLLVRPCLARVARWLHFFPKCVPVHKICNTTRGTLLVSKMCMKLVVYSSRTRGFDGHIFVVRTVNIFPSRPCRILMRSVASCTLIL
jgi:hypothetical protein